MSAAWVPLGIILAHVFGDYVFQSHWMATEKTSRWVPALLHAATYTACYLVVTRSFWALLVIGGTHAVLDRYRVARHVVWAKNHLGPRRTWRSWETCQATGFPPETPVWLAFWLMVVVDNAVHLAINTASTAWL